MKGICYLVCAGDPVPLDFTPVDGDLVIAVDGGYDHLRRAGLSPQLCVGDFDSLGVVPDEKNTVVLDPVKDVTDTFAAAAEGLERGYTEFRFYCALGGRLSHTLANIHTLAYLLHNGARGVIVGDGTEITVLDKFAAIGDCYYFSLFPLTETATVRIEGSKYDGTFTFTHADSLGVSNEPLQNATVTVLHGEVIAITEKNK